MLIVVSFQVFTSILFFSDFIIEYPNRNDFLLLLLLSSILVFFMGGYAVGIRMPIPVRRPINVNVLAHIGLISMAALLIPSIHAYTGSEITDFMSRATNPGEAHSEMIRVASQPREERIVLLAAKTLVSPFTVTVIPFFAYQVFQRRRHLSRYLIAIGLLVVFSVFRGTDKELIDIVILSVAASLAPLSLNLRKVFTARVFRLTVALALMFSITIAAFGFRKTDRVGEVAERCFTKTSICYSFEVMGRSGVGARTLVFLWSYLTQGYYGLSVALDAEFRPGYGLGHSRPLTYLASRMGVGPMEVTTDQLDSLGWSSKGAWSTGIAWIGNDVPFFLIPIVFGMIGILSGVAWIVTLRYGDGLALVIFCYLFYTMIYMPANLQLAQIGDAYLGVLSLSAVFIAQRVAAFLRLA